MGQTATADTVEVFAARIRQLKVENIKARGELRLARIDSAITAKHHAIDIQQMGRENDWLREQIPAWYQRPGFVAMIVAVITVWATLRAVQISL